MVLPLSRYLIALGSNLGDRQRLLSDACVALRQFGVVQAQSSLYETAPMYLQEQPAFLNAMVVLVSGLGPSELLDELHGAERAAGRHRAVPNGPRTLDLDMVACDRLVMATERLTIPHPRMTERPFVIFPLLEVELTWVHPVTGQTIATLASALQPPLRVCAPPW
jgi:2-amino-4-hydroxy-6-hydroxymethyldihydropteridine diphosphokinase